MKIPKLKGGDDPTARRRRIRLLVILGAALAFALLAWWPGGSAPAPSPATTSVEESPRPRRGSRAPLSVEDVPDLNLSTGNGELEEKVGRNVFRFYDPPTPTPTPPPTATPTPVLPGSPRFIGPLPILPTPTPTPIIPPAIPYKALGKFGPRDEPIVVLEEGNRLINAREGDTVDGRFIVRKINRESVDFAFVGLPPSITRRLAVPVP